jgi:uncharacterized protein (DUF305 family)
MSSAVLCRSLVPYRSLPHIAAVLAIFPLAAILSSLEGAASQSATPAADPCAATPTTGMAGMSGTPTPGMDAMSATASPGGTVPFDLLFIDAMIPHHESAIAMAEVALSRAEHQEITTLAQGIIAAQQAEIEQMRTWRQDWFGDAPAVPADLRDAFMSDAMSGMTGNSDSGMMMAGMDPASDIAALCATKESFDLAFIDLMIPHHQSAIAMAQVALDRASHAELRALDQQIVTGQQQEVDQMLAWRAAWSGSAAPPASPVATG